MTVSTLSRTQSTRQVETASTYGELFLEFHNANPHVYAALVDCARSWKRRTGRRVVGLDYLMGMLRWEYDLEINRMGGKHSFNAAFGSYYSRLIMRRCPDLDGLFKVRKSEADLFFTINYSRLV